MFEEDKMRKWVQITTWQEFMQQWVAARTEPGAVGLLYAGAKLKESGLRTDSETGEEDQARCFKSKVAFFLFATEVGNPIIEATARRLIMNELLHESLGLSWSGRIGPSFAHIIDFLGVVHPDVSQPPFPKKAEEFLFQAFTKWKTRERAEDLRQGKVRGELGSEVSPRVYFGAFYDRTCPLVKACVAWGVLPNILVTQRFAPERMEEIRAAAEPHLLASLGETDELREARYRGSLTWSMETKPPRDLYKEDGQTELWKRNGITLHYLRAMQKK